MEEKLEGKDDDGNNFEEEDEDEGYDDDDDDYDREINNVMDKCIRYM